MAARDMPPHGPTVPYDEIIDSSNIQCHICANVRVTSWAAIGNHFQHGHGVDVSAGFIGLQIQLDKCGPISDEEVAHVSIDHSSDLHFHCRKCIGTEGGYTRYNKTSAPGHFARHHPRSGYRKWFVMKDSNILKNKSGKQLLLTRAMQRHVATAPTVRNVTEADGGDDDEDGESSSRRGAPSDIPPDQSCSDIVRSDLPPDRSCSDIVRSALRSLSHERVLIPTPGTSTSRICLVPQSVAIELCAAAYIEPLDDGRLYWAPRTPVDMQQAVLLDILPDGALKRMMERTFGAATSSASIAPTPALAGSAAPVNIGAMHHLLRKWRRANTDTATPSHGIASPDPSADPTGIPTINAVGGVLNNNHADDAEDVQDDKDSEELCDSVSDEAASDEWTSVLGDWRSLRAGETCVEEQATLHCSDRSPQDHAAPQLGATSTIAPGTKCLTKRARSAQSHTRSASHLDRAEGSASSEDLYASSYSDSCILAPRVGGDLAPSDRDLILRHRYMSRGIGLKDTEEEYIVKMLRNIQHGLAVYRADYMPCDSETDVIIAGGIDIGALVGDAQCPLRYSEKVRNFMRELLKLDAEDDDASSVN